MGGQCQGVTETDCPAMARDDRWTPGHIGRGVRITDTCPVLLALGDIVVAQRQRDQRLFSIQQK